jgi:hypothetical protein
MSENSPGIMAPSGRRASTSTIDDKEEVRIFWTTFKEALIIVLGLVTTNAFSGFLESDVSGKYTTRFAFNLSNMLMLTTFLIIIFRFGFANIMFADELSRKARPSNRKDKFNHSVSFVALAFSALLLGLMSYYVNWEKYGATMYVWFLILCGLDSLWDISCWIVDPQKKFRKIWLANKLIYITLVLLIFGTMKDEFNPFSSPDITSPVWGHVFLLLIIITTVSSAISLITGHKLFFPFLFEADEVAPPPLVPGDTDRNK